MKSISSIVTYILLLSSETLFAQQSEKKVVITGVRFTYTLVQKWIDEYKLSNPDVNISIETRTTTDPAKYDLLMEAYEPEASVKGSRDYLYIGRYAILPVANNKSTFAKTYGEKGLTEELIKRIYFNDIYADKNIKKKIDEDYTIYTRLQKAGAPITFSHYFGFEQANINGKAISGADEHLVKALLKDTTGISYNIPGLLYDLKTRAPIEGLRIIPVDTDDNGRISSDEKFYDNLDTVLDRIEGGELKNIPVEYIHLSIARSNGNEDALKFLQWVAANGLETVESFGFLKLEPRRVLAEKQKFHVAIN